MDRCHIQACWDEALKEAGGWAARRAAVDEFNAKARTDGWRSDCDNTAIVPAHLPSVHCAPSVTFPHSA